MAVNPWAAVEQGNGNGAQDEHTGAQEEHSGNRAGEPAGQDRPRLPGKLAGWSSAAQEVGAMQAVGLRASIAKTEDIRVRIEQTTQGTKPMYIVYYYPTTGAVLPQGKHAHTVRARLAGWQAGGGQ